jgi:hypothetical protein
MQLNFVIGDLLEMGLSLLLSCIIWNKKKFLGLDNFFKIFFMVLIFYIILNRDDEELDGIIGPFPYYI